ncbi:MAG: hypothetical protein H7243_09680 [Sphingomonadaceae bacterium]|nr:hypothetical protein [Sphingomonadaceae bacterium]
MLKTMFAVGALALAVAVPATAQMAAAAPMAGGSLPKCSATVRDSCDQSMTTERYAMSAEAAMKTGGVGDRASDNAKAMPADHMMTHKHMMMHKDMMKHRKHMMKKPNNPETMPGMAPADAAKPM